jgi:hypothetical protein
VRLLGRDAAAVAGAVTRRCCRRYDRVQLRPQGRCSGGGLKTQVGTFFIKPSVSVYNVGTCALMAHRRESLNFKDFFVCKGHRKEQVPALFGIRIGL